MSTLSDNPEMMVEVIGALVKRLGGSVTITVDEVSEPFDLLSKFDQGLLHLVVDHTPQT